MTAVDLDSPAAEAGIRPGNRVLRAEDQPATAPDQVAKLLQAGRDAAPFTALLVRSGTNQRWVTITKTK